MKRVVADTNVLVSALQFGGKPKQLLDLAVDGEIDLAGSTEIVAETLRVDLRFFRRFRQNTCRPEIGKFTMLLLRTERLHSSRMSR